MYVKTFFLNQEKNGNFHLIQTIFMFSSTWLSNQENIWQRIQKCSLKNTVCNDSPSECHAIFPCLVHFLCNTRWTDTICLLNDTVDKHKSNIIIQTARQKRWMLYDFLHFKLLVVRFKYWTRSTKHTEANLPTTFISQAPGVWLKKNTNISILCLNCHTKKRKPCLHHPLPFALKCWFRKKNFKKEFP